MTPRDEGLQEDEAALRRAADNERQRVDLQHATDVAVAQLQLRRSDQFG
jgi:hypothetical protein